MSVSLPAILILAFFIWGGMVDSASATDKRECGIEHVGQWPKDNSDLTWNRNENAEGNGPVYRLFTEVDVRKVEPDKEYQITLKSLVSYAHLKRFLIWAEEEEETNHCGYGMLRSLSDATEHLAYNCPRYLVERSHDFQGSDSVQFQWQAPKCGCSSISVQVLDGEDEIYTTTDDPYNALHLRACVDGSSSNAGEDAVDEVLPQADQPVAQGKKQSRKKILKAKGKLACCKGGVQAFKNSNSDVTVCDSSAAPEDLTAQSMANFKLPEVRCSDVYSICCKDKTKLKRFKKQLRKAKTRGDTRQNPSTEDGQSM